MRWNRLDIRPTRPAPPGEPPIDRPAWWRAAYLPWILVLTVVVASVSAVGMAVLLPAGPEVQLADAERVVVPLDLELVASARCPTPCLALVITEVGLAAETVERALALPPPVTLAVSAYTPAAGELYRRTRARDHDMILELPVQPAPPSLDDAGPDAITPAMSAAEAQGKVEELLHRAGEPSAVAIAAVPPDGRERGLGAALAVLAEKGVGVLKLGTPGGADEVPPSFTDGVHAIPLSDTAPTAQGLDLALGQLEGAALSAGVAVGYAPALPVTLDRLAAWLPTLRGKGIEVVPLSRLLAPAET